MSEPSVLHPPVLGMRSSDLVLPVRENSSSCRRYLGLIKCAGIDERSLDRERERDLLLGLRLGGDLDLDLDRLYCRPALFALYDLRLLLSLLLLLLSGEAVCDELLILSSCILGLLFVR